MAKPSKLLYPSINLLSQYSMLINEVFIDDRDN